MTSLVAQLVKNPPTMQEIQVRSLGGKDPLEKEMATHSSILAWKIHGQRSLAGYSPWCLRVGPNLGTKLLPLLGASQVAPVVKNPSANAGDIRDVGWIPGLGKSPGEGHGKQLQYSWLENPMDRGAWWAGVYRVAQSQTRLKQFSMHTIA